MAGTWKGVIWSRQGVGGPPAPVPTAPRCWEEEEDGETCPKAQAAGGVGAAPQPLATRTPGGSLDPGAPV